MTSFKCQSKVSHERFLIWEHLILIFRSPHRLRKGHNQSFRSFPSKRLVHLQRHLKLQISGGRIKPAWYYVKCLRLDGAAEMSDQGKKFFKCSSTNSLSASPSVHQIFHTKSLILINLSWQDFSCKLADDTEQHHGQTHNDDVTLHNHKVSGLDVSDLTFQRLVGHRDETKTVSHDGDCLMTL